MRKFPKNGLPGRSELVVRQLEERILSGEWQAGDCIPTEQALGVEFSASRTVIREALQTMKTRGLIRSRRGSGTYVAEPGGSRVRESLGWYAALQHGNSSFLELMDLRILVETHCTKLLAGERGNLEEVSRHLKSMGEHLANPHRFADSDIAFHLAIVRASGHVLFGEVAEAVLPTLGRVYARQTLTDAKMAGGLLEEHQQIYFLISTGDGAAASEAMHAHLQRSRANLLSMMKACGEGSTGGADSAKGGAAGVHQFA